MAYKNSDTARARRKKTVPEPAPAPGRRSRPPLRANRGRIERPDRASRRARDLPHHGLHHVRQPGDPREGRHGPWRRVRRHLPCRCGRLGHHGALRQLPIALAPGMGLNAYFAFTVVPELGGNWQLALTLVFISSVLFFALSLSPLRAWLIDAIPLPLKLGIAAGIGFFLALIGLQNAGIVTRSPRDARHARHLFHCDRHRARLHRMWR